MCLLWIFRGSREIASITRWCWYVAGNRSVKQTESSTMKLGSAGNVEPHYARQTLKAARTITGSSSKSRLRLTILLPTSRRNISKPGEAGQAFQEALTPNRRAGSELPAFRSCGLGCAHVIRFADQAEVRCASRIQEEGCVIQGSKDSTFPSYLLVFFHPTAACLKACFCLVVGKAAVKSQTLLQINVLQ